MMLAISWRTVDPSPDGIYYAWWAYETKVEIDWREHDRHVDEEMAHAGIPESGHLAISDVHHTIVNPAPPEVLGDLMTALQHDMRPYCRMSLRD